MRILKVISIILAAGFAVLPIKAIAQQGGGMGVSASSQMPTGTVAAKLNALANSLVASGNSPEAVEDFLLRCAFTCFAEDSGIIQKGAFVKVLKAWEVKQGKRPGDLTELWRGMKNSGGGWLFETPEALSLSDEQVRLLVEVAVMDWSQVSTTVLGTIAERALEPLERKQLGVHYTPASYVERLVMPTIIEPLKAEWDAVDKKDAVAVRRFHERLCNTTILDPACGSGNFLAVSFELLNDLDLQVLAKLRDLGQPEPKNSISIQQFKGLEIAPHAADVCELALRVSWLRSYYKTHKTAPEVADNRRVIECHDALLGDVINPHPTEWPNCEFIIGNPPFVGSAKKKKALGANYVKALRNAYADIPGNSDLVMYWWAKAAELLRDGRIHRFGFITTSAIRSKCNSRIVDRFLTEQPPISIIFAVPEHPWEVGGANVRISMTVCEKGDKPGILASAIAGDFKKEAPQKINARLSGGADALKAKPLKANDGFCAHGVMLCNPGFIVPISRANELGLGSVPGTEEVILDYANGRDISLKARDVLLLDLSNYQTEDEVKQKFPLIYNYLLENVKPQISQSQKNWWQFGGKRDDTRRALGMLKRYIATSEHAKDRYFIFLDKKVVPDHTLVTFASDDAYYLGILSSKVHTEWCEATESHLGSASVYAKSVVFDTFPFPEANDAQKQKVREAAEKLDAFRSGRQKENQDLTMSAIYSVLEKVQDGGSLTTQEEVVAKQANIKELAKLHADIDAAVFEAYGWSKELSDDQIVEKVLALNHRRAEEEAKGQVRWLRQ